MTTRLDPAPWMKTTLVLAGVYNLIRAGLIVAIPQRTLDWFGRSSQQLSPQLWQTVGILVGVFGVGYLIASRDPYRHWPVTLAGLLGKLLEPLGVASLALAGHLQVSMGWTILAIDLIWWGPFGAILWGALRYRQSVGSVWQTSERDDPLMETRTIGGQSLDELAVERPQLVVFLRHSGCTFCREALADIAAQRDAMEALGAGIVVVSLDRDDKGCWLFHRYGLDDIPQIRDAECRLYRHFDFGLANVAQLLAPPIWIRGFVTAFVRGHGAGRLRGNVFQMPGVCLYHRGQVLGIYRHTHASDRPNYVELVKQFVASQSDAVAD